MNRAGRKSELEMKYGVDLRQTEAPQLEVGEKLGALRSKSGPRGCF